MYILNVDVDGFFFQITKN